MSTRPVLTVPFDQEAERSVVGIVIGNPFAFKPAAAIVGPEDFYHPSLGRLFAAAADLASLQVGLTASERVAAGWDQGRRAAEAAASVDPVDQIGSDPNEVAKLLSEAPVLLGVEPWARRVVKAARARRVMVAAEETFNRLGAGESLDDVRQLLESALAA